MAQTGKIFQVIGSTFDAEFPEEAAPAIYNALTVQRTAGGDGATLTGEVQQHLGGGRVRCVALGSTDGLRRGMAVTDTGKPAGYLRTTEDFTNYTLHLQMRHVTAGNSGVMLRMVGAD